jgi:hypothetical protein
MHTANTARKREILEREVIRLLARKGLKKQAAVSEIKSHLK